MLLSIVAPVPYHLDLDLGYMPGLLRVISPVPRQDSTGRLRKLDHRKSKMLERTQEIFRPREANLEMSLSLIPRSSNQVTLLTLRDFAGPLCSTEHNALPRSDENTREICCSGLLLHKQPCPAKICTLNTSGRPGRGISRRYTPTDALLASSLSPTHGQTPALHFPFQR
jgi:hypothetical protein